MAAATVAAAAVAAILLSAILPSSAGFVPYYHVHIVNNLRGKVLLVRCRSSNRDLGDQNIQVGSEFEWKLHRQVWRSTNWVCYLAPDYYRHAFFQAYTDFTPDYNHNVYWVAKEDGVYVRDGSGKYADVFKFRWDAGRNRLHKNTNSRLFSFL